VAERGDLGAVGQVDKDHVEAGIERDDTPWIGLRIVPAGCTKAHHRARGEH
jgi:hypothetical protein